MRFLHTADWQLGKPFAGTEDSQKRALLQNERFTAVRRLGQMAREKGAEFIVVAGDLFDSPSATKATVSAACSAIGSIELPVYAIPGNHDHGGPGSLWNQDFFTRERAALAPNLQLLLKPEPLEVAGAVLFPCPLLRRHEAYDPTTWLRSGQAAADQSGGKPRIIIAHGSVLNFGLAQEDDESDGGAANIIDLSRLPEETFDYIALGDWHGTKEISPRAWYSGTPELDRFVKSQDHRPGNVLVVDVHRGQLPTVEVVRTGAMGWHELNFILTEDDDLPRLEGEVDRLIGPRANQDLVCLRLEGSLGIEATVELEKRLETWSARLIRLKLDNRVHIRPSPEELEELTRRAEDPLVARVAGQLVEMAGGHDEKADVARLALRRLHAACQPN